MASEEVLTIQDIDTQLYADSAEWCPFEGLQDALLCGTYQLVEEPDKSVEPGQPQERVGQLQLYQLGNPHSDPQLSKCQGVDMPGILDIKWARGHLGTLPVFGMVNAVGQLQLWKVGPGDKATAGNKESVVAEHMETTEIADCIGLSLDWAAHVEGSLSRVVTSDSRGDLTVFEVGSDLSKISHWKAHDYEAWICAFDQWNVDVIYSGADDSKMKVWDLRVGTTPVSTNSRFLSGVCSIQSNPHHEHLLAVGSYDEKLRVFDTRQMRQPMSIAELGGGIWRVKWDPVNGQRISTATMYNGFHIVDCSQPDAETLPIKAHYTHHSTLAYGVDWCRLQPKAPCREDPDTTCGADAAKTEAFFLASCSFYDHSLQLWKWTT